MSERSCFQVGDRVRIHCPGNSYHGEETTVVGRDVATINSYGRDGDDGYFLRGEVVYELDLKDCTTERPAMPARYLRPVYDGHRPAKWSALADIWQPKVNA